MSDEETQIVNGKPGVFLKFCKEIEPGAMIVLGLFVVGLGVTLNISVRCLDKNQALMQRDIASINMRMASEDYTSAGSVPMALHQIQMETIHNRISELNVEQNRMWDRINTMEAN